MGNRFTHLPEDIFDRMDAACSRIRLGVFSPTSLNQIAQDFPIVARLSRAADRAIEPLESPFTVDHRSAFFCKAERWQYSGRRLDRFIRQNIHDDNGG